MPRNARCVEPGLAYHVTQRGTNRERVFLAVADYKLYLELLRTELARAHVEVLAYCLMSNHAHLVVVPRAADALGALFRRVHGRYAQYANVRRGRTGHLWQQRFFSCPMSEKHLWVGLRYVERNPCRAALVAAPEQYRWSSAVAHLGMGTDRSGVLDMGSGSVPATRRPGEKCTRQRSRPKRRRSSGGQPTRVGRSERRRSWSVCRRSFSASGGELPARQRPRKTRL